MTITYTHEVANSRMGGFTNLLLKWRGSVYKLFYKEFAIYIALYSLLSVCYRVINVSEFKEYFEKLCLQFQSYTDLIPISFVLGFYVSMVVGRWWQQFMYLPWPDKLMVMITSNVHGSDHRGRLIRRTLVRYLSLAEVLTYRSISTAVYKRFPTMQHVIDAGFMTPAEYKQYEKMKTKHVKYFIPLVWFSNLLSKVRQERRIYDDITYLEILKEMNNFRSNCGTLFCYDWISIPLVYTQVVTVAVYVFFLSTLLSRQYLDVEKNYPGHIVDLYVPIFTICQFFFYMGWLKVAEQLINPFGEDDDDFEVNFIIDRNLEIAMLTVDDMYLSHPKLERDMYWNEPNPSIPYTAASVNHKMDVFLGSTMDMSLDQEEIQFVDQIKENGAIECTHQMDLNHNYLEVRNPALAKSSPVGSNDTRILSPSPKISQNLWKIFRGRDKVADVKQSLIDRVKGDGVNSLDALINEENSDMNDSHSSDSDDFGDSDVGDGGGSEDEVSDGNKSGRRSSLSSVNAADEDECDRGENNRDEPDRSPHIRKHTIDEPEDLPRAKKLKSLPSSNPKSRSVTKTTTRKSAQKSKKPNLLVVSFNRNHSANSSDRFSFAGKEKKSPKRRVSMAKINKRLDFSRRIGEETEEERRNAQNRTFEQQQKLSKKKSLQALQRNARRTNYPGNAWLRHKNPRLWRDFNPPDYASVTSGADDKPDFDSPFGSINSFATSIPSPRPLRFSHFAKRVKQSLAKQIDGDSTSSCVTSPCANDDFSPSFPFSNSSTNAREEGSVNMPFTDDLRRRLLVVHSMNSPTSPAAHSPLLGYASSNGTSSTISRSDDFESNITQTSRSGAQSTTWENKLEVIGEISPQTLDVKSERRQPGIKTLQSVLTYQNEQCRPTRRTKTQEDILTSDVKEGLVEHIQHHHENDLHIRKQTFNSEPRILNSNDSPTLQSLSRSRSCPSVPSAEFFNVRRKEKPPESSSTGAQDLEDSGTTGVIIQIA